MVEMHKIALDVDFDHTGRFCVLEVMANLTNFLIKTTDGVVGTFVLAARVAIGKEVAFPVIVDFHVDVVMNDAIREGCGENLTDNGLVGDESDTLRGYIFARVDGGGEFLEVVDGVEIERIFVFGL